MNVARVLFVFQFLLSASVLSLSFFCQYHLNIEPCVLCIVQRLLLAFLGLLAFVAVCHPVKSPGKKGYACVLLLLSMLGLIVAGRQLWLQHLPAGQVLSCGPGLSYLLKTAPPLEILRFLLKGTQACGKVTFYWCGFSLAAWSALIFSSLCAINLAILCRFSRK